MKTPLAWLAALSTLVTGSALAPPIASAITTFLISRNSGWGYLLSDITKQDYIPGCTATNHNE